MDQYRKERMFEHGLEEFDDSRCVVFDLTHGCLALEPVHYWHWRWVDVITDGHRFWLECFSATVEETMNEYKACESPDYISYVSQSYSIHNLSLTVHSGNRRY
jgi:hypothetical protein